MLFKGTARRPAGEIAREVEAAGGRMNAATSDDYTFYFLTLPAESLELGVDILADIASSATFPPEEMERERQVILEEIRRRKDHPVSELWEEFSRIAYPSIPYGRPVIGTTATIAAMTREDLLHFYRRYYTVRNLCLVIAGEVDPDRAFGLARQKFRGLRSHSPPKRPDLREKNPGHSRRALSRAVQKTYLATGFVGPTIRSDDHYALDAAAAVLGSGRASRLWRNIRERGWAESVSASFYTQAGSGLFGVYAEIHPSSAAAATEKIRQELVVFSVEGPTKEEMARARRMLSADWILAEQSVHSRAHRLGWSWAVKDAGYAREYLKKVLAQDSRKIRRVFKKYLPFPYLPQATVGPAEP